MAGADGDEEFNQVHATEDRPEIVPGSRPPEVPAEGTYIDAMNEAGIDP